jgi:predicted nucleotidyltransferase
LLFERFEGSVQDSRLLLLTTNFSNIKLQTFQTSNSSNTERGTPKNMKSTRKELFNSIKAVLLSVEPEGKVILFGSRARGDSWEGSDWDLLILLNKPKIESTDFDRIAYPLCELGWREGEQISPKLYTINDWNKRSFTPFYKNIEKEGIEL